MLSIVHEIRVEVLCHLSKGRVLYADKHGICRWKKKGPPSVANTVMYALFRNNLVASKDGVVTITSTGEWYLRVNGR